MEAAYLIPPFALGLIIGLIVGYFFGMISREV